MFSAFNLTLGIKLGFCNRERERDERWKSKLKNGRKKTITKERTVSR
jgi:hypothetical protein